VKYEMLTVGLQEAPLTMQAA